MKFYTKLICVMISFFLISPLLIGVSNSDSEVRKEKRIQEKALYKKIAKATASFLQVRNNSNSQEVDLLVDQLLAVDKPSVKAYFISAKAEDLLGNYQKAISILEETIAEYPEEKAPGLNISIKYVGLFRISNIAKKIGDFQKAKNTYETLLMESGNIENEDLRKYIQIVCNLYLAEIEHEKFSEDKVALNKLNNVINQKAPNDGEWSVLYNFYIDLAKYKIGCISDNKANASLMLTSNIESLNIASYVAAHHLSLIGADSSILSDYLSGNNRDVLIESSFEEQMNISNSSYDKNLTRLTAGFVKQEEGDYSNAGLHYLNLYNENSFLSPIAGVYLARCQQANGKSTEAVNMLNDLKAKYPGYSTVVDEMKGKIQTSNN